MGLEWERDRVAVKFERCHVLLPSWPTNSISSGGPEGLLTFEAADGVFPQVFQGRRNGGGLVWLFLLHGWPEDHWWQPLNACWAQSHYLLTLLKRSYFFSWAFLSFLAVLDKTKFLFACERLINIGQYRAVPWYRRTENGNLCTSTIQRNLMSLIHNNLQKYTLDFKRQSRFRAKYFVSENNKHLVFMTATKVLVLIRSRK